MMQQLSAYIKNTSYYVTNCFPFVFCMAVCLKSDLLIAFSFCLISLLFIPETDNKKMMPLILSFLIIGFNPDHALGASLVCALLLIISSFFADKIKKLFTSPFASGVMIAGALTVTVLFTTHYFGIGATGNSVTEMIKSYISLGFHPNWRGVLYGTIVLVIMITFPKKFRIFSKYVSPSFVAVVFTLILNLFLNPSDMISSINEISSPFNQTAFKEYYISRIGFEVDFKTLLIGVALFIIYFYSVSSEDNAKQKDYVSCGIANIIFSGLCGIPIPYPIKKVIDNPLPKISAMIILFIAGLLFEDVILRIPLHSCAVVIIVASWNSVKWGDLKKQFSGLIPFICFILSAITCLSFNLFYGIIISFIISSLYSKFTHK